MNTKTTTNFQAAVKIQRAWRKYYKTCPYCGVQSCNGIYSEFKCPEMWEETDLIKLDTYIDRLHGRWLM